MKFRVRLKTLKFVFTNSRTRASAQKRLAMCIDSALSRVLWEQLLDLYVRDDSRTLDEQKNLERDMLEIVRERFLHEFPELQDDNRIQKLFQEKV